MEEGKNHCICLSVHKDTRYATVHMWRSEETPWLIGVVGLGGGSVLYLL